MSERRSHDLGTPLLRLEREGHLAWCTIDRPASRNALSGAMYFGVKRAVQLVNAWPEPTALVATGVGDMFAPGGELRGRVEDPNPALEQLAWEDGAEAREGMQAFAEKRAPSWIPKTLQPGKRL